MKELKIGVIGTAGRGVLADLAHDPAKGNRIVAGADIVDKALDAFKERIAKDVFATNDYRELLKRADVDAVFICTPDYLHAEHAVAALEAGKAVYLEKPMAITIEECDRILKTAMTTKSKLFLGHNMRHFPAILKMKEVIDSGIIGEVQACWCRHFVGHGGDFYFRDWHSEQKNTTGLLLQKGAHDIDVIHWLMNTTTAAVSGMGMLSVYDKCERRSGENEAGDRVIADVNRFPPLEQDDFSSKIDVEDHAMIMMQMDNGAQATYLECHYTPDYERNYTFIGTKGRLENNGDHGDCEVLVWTRRGPRQTPDIIHRLKPLEGGHGGADSGIIPSFLDYVRHDRKPNTSPVAARNAVAVGVLGHRSMRSDGSLQEIPQLAQEVIDYFDKQ